ncbi:MAG: EAL domain-containing protein [Zoogloea sp.]|uniref:bifunctional diguanylate cyclase/phosphodiesterase n=1 Tax=Zoogloea sp. TaxID=49181 RepID=UPI00263879A9|nr:EAL domain-containing protein [Zoogloea sp.]MDD3327963.1 EAL domain-containing protein [Zoogloea sp.]
MKLQLTDRNLQRYHLTGTLVVVVVLALALAGSFLWIGLTEHRQITQRFEQAQQNRIHERLQAEMDAALGYLDFLQARTEATLREALRARVTTAFQIAHAIHEREHGRHPEAEVKRLILETLRPQRFFDERGYFVVRDLKGIALLQPLSPELENTSLWDNHDDTGHYITRGLVEAALRSDEGGFSAYRWYPPDNRQGMSDKLAYTRLFKPYGWVIGTGDYLDQWHAARLKEGIERLRAWRFGDTGRFEVLGLDGTLLLHASGGEEGKDYRQLGSPEEQAIRGRMIALARQGGGLLEYPWHQPGSDVVDTRSALVQRFAPWNIVLVATLSSREIQAAIDVERATAWASLSSRLPYAGLVAVLAILGAILASALFSRWMIGLLQGYKRDLDAHTLALEQKAGELLLAGHVFESSKEGILITDAESRILAVNPAFTEISGYRPEDVVGKQPDLLASGKHEPDFYRNMWQTIRETGSWSGEIWNQRRDGSVFPELLQITTVRSASGEVLHYVGTFLDLTERKEAEDRIRQLAEFDPLTGLPNRSLLGDRMAQAMARAERENRRVAALVLDLDRFKTINDSLGHAIGDQLLQGVATRLRDLVRHSDTVSRLGGDEFVVVLTGLEHPAQALPAARKILEALAAPFQLGEHELLITPSIGIALYPDNAGDPETLLKHAEAAMYHAKNQGRNTFQFFTPEFNHWATDRLRIENGLRHALARSELLLHFQPQVDLATRSIVGCEALLRWQPADSEMVMPDRFIPVAEETGLIVPIGNWVLEQACHQLARWDAEGAVPIRMAVNVAVPQLRQPGFVDGVRRALQRAGLTPERLEIEVTESVLLEKDERISQTLEGLLALGTKLSLDDFGTGYASLSYLRNFRFNVLKIDRSFVSELHHNEADIKLIRAIISIARDLSLQTVAEGVESEVQLEILQELGCNLGQGYHFSRPVPAARMGELLHGSQRA